MKINNPLIEIGKKILKEKWFEQSKSSLEKGYQDYIRKEIQLSYEK